MSPPEKNHPPSALAPTSKAGGAKGASVDPARHAQDLELMQRVASGDARAQRLLANRLVVRVRRAAHALMRGSVDADDAAQHALIEILRSAHTYRGDSSVERWCDRITGRSVIRFARAVRRRNSITESGLEADTLGTEAPEGNPNESVPRNLEEYLSRLPEARREVLLLKHAFGHSVEEIAEMTQTSPNTVKDRLLAARRDLRRLITRERTVGAPKGRQP